MWSGRESRRLRDPRWEFSFWLPKRPFVTVGANHWYLKSLLFTGKWKRFLASYFSLAILNKFKTSLCFLPQQGAIKPSLKFLLWLYLIFPKRYFSSMLFFVASKYVKWTETWFERVTSESIKLQGRWFAEATFCSCMYPSLEFLLDGVLCLFKSKPGLKWLQCVLSVSA